MQADTTNYFVVWWVLLEYSSFDHFPNGRWVALLEATINFNKAQRRTAINNADEYEFEAINISCYVVIQVMWLSYVIEDKSFSYKLAGIQSTSFYSICMHLFREEVLIFCRESSINRSNLY